jgi:hypothetical protein
VPSNEPVSIDPPGLTLPLLAERIDHERELRDQAYSYLDTALRLQAAEYTRRLDVLNHAHQQTVEAQARTVPREMFDQFVKENSNRAEVAHLSLQDRLNSMEQLADRREGALSTWRFIAGFLGLSGVVGVVLGVVALFGPK